MIAPSPTLAPLASIDTPEASGTMQLLTHDGYLYCGHLSPGGGTTILDVRDPRAPRIAGHLAGFPGTFSPKVQVADGLLIVNYEFRTVGAARCGIGVFDLTNPEAPREISYLPTGGTGVHRLWYDGGRYAYLSGCAEGFRGNMLMIADLADPAHPAIVGRWWVPGSWAAGGEEPPSGAGELGFYTHHAIVAGDRAYVGCWDWGLAILDISDRTAPKQIAHVGPWAPLDGGATHTALPLLERGLLVVTDESIRDLGAEPHKHIRIFDITDERAPHEIARMPQPPLALRTAGGRFGPHNLHENRRGTFVSDQLIVASYFNAGVRVYDIRDPHLPVEVASYVPPPPPGQPTAQSNDLTIDERGIVYVSDRNFGRITILELH